MNYKVLGLCFLFNLHIWFVKYGVEMNPEYAFYYECPVNPAPEISVTRNGIVWWIFLMLEAMFELKHVWNEIVWTTT